jgi:hypothetical protein
MSPLKQAGQMCFRFMDVDGFHALTLKRQHD